MTLEQFREIALHAAKGTAPTNFTKETGQDCMSLF